jgi:hypothetical protein
MQQNPDNIANLGNRLASYVAVERRKVMVAVCLIVVMGIMWTKLLTGKGEPSSATAATNTAMPLAETKATALRITYKELPIVEGRNDTVAVDFFSPGDWRAFLSKDASEPLSSAAGSTKGSTGEDARSQAIREIAAGLRLQIMEIGSEPQAFISDNLVREGSELTIVAGESAFDFKVLRITRQMVELRCDDKTFEVRLKDK